MTKRSHSSRTPIIPGILFVSMMISGRIRPVRSYTNRSVLPAKGLARPSAPARSTLVGAVKLEVGTFAPDRGGHGIGRI
jgi:hypothetical protein